MNRRILILAAAAALAAPSTVLANEVLLCSDVPGCMQMHQANRQAEMLTDAQFKLKLRAAHHLVEIQDRRHDVEVQKLKAVIDELHGKRMQQEAQVEAFIKAITDEARRKLEMCVPGTCPSIPQ